MHQRQRLKHLLKSPHFCSSILFVLGVLWANGAVLAQRNTPLPAGLQTDLSAGNISALYGLASLLDHPDFAASAQSTLRATTDFLPTEVNPQLYTNRRILLEFLALQHQSLAYSPVLNCYYLTAFEDRDVDFKITPFELQKSPCSPAKSCLANLETLVAAQQWEPAIKRLYDLAQNLRWQPDPEFLEPFLALLDLPKGITAPPSFWNASATVLVNCHDKKAALALNEWFTQNKLSEAEFIDYSTRLTNRSPAIEAPTETALVFMKNRLIEADSLRHIRRDGYQMHAKTSWSTFQQPLEFWALSSIRSLDKPWLLENAVTDMVRTREPRALFYLSCLVLQLQQFPEGELMAQKIVEELEYLTSETVEVTPKNDWLTDRAAVRDWVVYWAKHHDEYRWDDFEERFIRKERLQKIKRSFDLRFRLLQSTDDSSAFAAFAELLETEPLELERYREKYRSVLREVNPRLPSLRQPYLESLSSVYAYCRSNGLPYQLSNAQESILEPLKAASLGVLEREKLEKNSAAAFSIAQTTGLERWAFLNESNAAASLSAARILDQLYLRHRDSVLNDPEQLRLFAVKAHYYGRINTGGMAQNYSVLLQGLSPNDQQELTAWLQQLTLTTTDLFSTAEQVTDAAITLDELSDALLNVDRYSDLSKRFFDPELTAAWFALNNRGQINGQVLFESLEQCWSLPTNWLKTNAQPFAEVRDAPTFISTLTEQLTVALEGQTETDPVLLKTWTYLPTLTAADRKFFLAAFAKLPTRKQQLGRYRPPFKFVLAEDLPYLQQQQWNYRDFSPLERMLELETDAEKSLFLAFVTEQTNRFSLEDQAFVWNDLFRKSWYLDGLDRQLFDEHKKQIREQLDAYLESGMIRSLFEERTTATHLWMLDHTGQSWSKIVQELEDVTNPELRKSIEKTVVSRLDWQELPDFLPFYNHFLSIAEEQPLLRDFGLPIFGNPSDEVLGKLSVSIANDTPEAVYLMVLNGCGVRLKRGDQLDYEQISDLLNAGIASPFSANGGTFDDRYTLAVCKLLEHHFNQNLGFEAAHFERQSNFYSTPVERARAWLNYLTDHGFLENAPPPSLMWR